MKDDSMMPLAIRPDHDINPGEIVFGAAALTIEDVLTVARQGAIVRLSDDPGAGRAYEHNPGYHYEHGRRPDHHRRGRSPDHGSR